MSFTAYIFFYLIVAPTPSLAVTEPLFLKYRPENLGEFSPEGWIDINRSPSFLYSYRPPKKEGEPIEVRSEGIVPHALGKLLTVITDPEIFKKFMPSLVNFKKLFDPPPTETNYFVYQHFNTGPFRWFISDRDLVAHIQIQPDKPKQKLSIFIESKDLDKEPKKKGIVRAQIFQKSLILSVEKGTKTYFVNRAKFNFKGKLPMWLFNWMMKNNAKKGMERFLEYLANNEVEIHSLVQDWPTSVQ